MDETNWIRFWWTEVMVTLWTHGFSSSGCDISTTQKRIRFLLVKGQRSLFCRYSQQWWWTFHTNCIFHKILENVTWSLSLRHTPKRRFLNLRIYFAMGQYLKGCFVVYHLITSQNTNELINKTTESTNLTLKVKAHLIITSQRMQNLSPAFNTTPEGALGSSGAAPGNHLVV